MLYNKYNSSITGNRLRILFADDCEADLHFYKSVITESLTNTHSIDIETCNSLSCMTKKLEENQDYNIIILDLNLTDSRGSDTLNKVLEIVDFSIPIIIVTGLNDTKIKNKCIKAGAGDFIVKGVNDNNLISIILSFCFEQKKMRKNLRNFA